MTREITTHRLLQISVLADTCEAGAAQLIRAANNAKSINAIGFWRQAVRRAMRLSKIGRACRAILSHAEWLRRAPSCGSRLQSPLLARRGNALNIEIGASAARCLNKRPREWAGRGASALRWIASGGSPFVFGQCNAQCGQITR
jgi:hypothetical protein